MRFEFRLRQRRAGTRYPRKNRARRRFGRWRRTPRSLCPLVIPARMPVEPGPQGRKATIRRAKHAHPGIGIEQLTARPLVPFVHPDHRQRPIGTGRRLDDGRRPGAARGSVRKDHRHDKRAEAGIVHEGIETKSESLRGLQHFGGQVGRIGDRAEIGHHLVQCLCRFCFQRRQRNTMRFGLVGADHRRPARRREDSDASRPGRRLGLGKERRRLEHRLEIVDCDRAGLLDRRLVGDDRADHRSRVRHRRLAAGFAVAGLVDDQRLAGIARFSRGLQESARRPSRLPAGR